MLVLMSSGFPGALLVFRACSFSYLTPLLVFYPFSPLPLLVFSLLKKKKKIILYVCVVCLLACVSGLEARGGQQIPWNWSLQIVVGIMWELGTNPSRLEEQPVLLATESSLQPLSLFLSLSPSLALCTLELSGCFFRSQAAICRPGHCAVSVASLSVLPSLLH